MSKPRYFLYGLTLFAAAFALLATENFAAADAFDCNGCIDKRDIGKKQVRSKHIKTNAIKSSKIKDNSVNAADLASDAVFGNILLVRSDLADPIGNCEALRAALSGITDNSATNGYMIKLEPGVYDCSGNSGGSGCVSNLGRSPTLTSKVRDRASRPSSATRIQAKKR